METPNSNYYILPFHSEAGPLLEELGFTWFDDQIDDNRDIDSFIINGYEKTFALYDSKNLDRETDRLQNQMNEKIISVTFKDIQLWQN